MFSSLVEEIRFALESSQSSPVTTRIASPRGAEYEKENPTSSKHVGRGWRVPGWKQKATNKAIRRGTDDRYTGGEDPVDSTLPPEDMHITQKSKKSYMGKGMLAAGVASGSENEAALSKAQRAISRVKAAKARAKARAKAAKRPSEGSPFAVESFQQSVLNVRKVSPAAMQGVRPSSRGRWLDRQRAEQDRQDRNTSTRRSPVGDDNGGEPVDSTLPPKEKLTRGETPYLAAGKAKKLGSRPFRDFLRGSKR